MKRISHSSTYRIKERFIKSIALFFLIGVLCPALFSSCFKAKEKAIEHSVILIMMENGKVVKESPLTSYHKDSTIYKPSEYKVFPSLVSGYVVLNDLWYNTATMESTAYFPMQMPDSDVKLYARVRPLTALDAISFESADVVEAFFESKAPLQDSWGTPSKDSDTSYYEIVETPSAATGIENIVRYYPKTKTVVLIRGYTKNQPLANGSVLIQDGYSIGMSVNLEDKTITCKGIYTRTSASSSGSYSDGTVEISYTIPSLSVDNETEPLVPNFSTIKFTSSITNATNITKMQELWNSEKYDIAEKCYSQLNSVLKTLGKNIVLFRAK